MKRPKVSIIAAIAENRAIGKDNKLLWHIPEDLARFKKITFNHPVIMGRTTFKSLGKPLPYRINIVVTRNKNYQVEGCLIVNSLEEAIRQACENDEKEIFIIGGGQIYEQAIKFADKLYLTVVKGNFEADTFFPDYSRFTKVVHKKPGQYKQYKYTFFELEKEKMVVVNNYGDRRTGAY